MKNDQTKKNNEIKIEVHVFKLLNIVINNYFEALKKSMKAVVESDL